MLHPVQVKGCSCIRGKEKLFPLPRGEILQIHCGYLDLHHLKQQHKSEWGCPDPGCLGMWLGPGTSAGSWPYFPLLTCSPTVPPSSCPPPALGLPPNCLLPTILFQSLQQCKECACLSLCAGLSPARVE